VEEEAPGFQFGGGQRAPGRKAGHEPPDFPHIAASARVECQLDWLTTRRGAADVALFPVRVVAVRRRGISSSAPSSASSSAAASTIELNRLSAGTRYVSSARSTSTPRLLRFARPDARMVHRVDGPIGVYRGYDDGTDRRIAALNAELANATVVQSRYSLEKHRELGLELRSPVVISNTVDPALFHPPAEHVPLAGRKARVVATSWSNNVRKGTETLSGSTGTSTPIATSSRSWGARRPASSGSASSAPSRRRVARLLGSTTSTSPRAGTTLLERPARGARLRLPAAYLERCHPSSSATQDFPSARTTARRCSTGSSRVRRAARGDQVPSLATSRTGTSSSSSSGPPRLARPWRTTFAEA
jgi:hypothetical protein